jgi:hypothetical protein
VLFTASQSCHASRRSGSRHRQPLLVRTRIRKVDIHREPRRGGEIRQDQRDLGRWDPGYIHTSIKVPVRDNTVYSSHTGAQASQRQRMLKHLASHPIVEQRRSCGNRTAVVVSDHQQDYLSTGKPLPPRAGWSCWLSGHVPVKSGRKYVLIRCKLYWGNTCR